MAADDDFPRGRSNRSIHQKSLEGRDLGRLLALTDGVFAFAITLLVLQLVIPICGANGSENCVVGALGADISRFLAYLFTFFIIGIWWMRHNSLFHYMARYDSTLLWINLVFLLMIAVSPFILGLFAEYSGDLIAVLLFGLVEAAAGFLLLGMWAWAARAKLLGPEADGQVIRYHERRGFIVPAIFLATAALALVNVNLSTIGFGAALVASIVLRRT